MMKKSGIGLEIDYADNNKNMEFLGGKLNIEKLNLMNKEFKKINLNNIEDKKIIIDNFLFSRFTQFEYKSKPNICTITENLLKLYKEINLENLELDDDFFRTFFKKVVTLDFECDLGFE